MKDIEPNPRLNKIAAGLIGVLALFFVYLAFETSVLIESEEWVFVAVLAVIALILLLCALWLWRSPPMNAAHLRFRSGGFRVETKQVFRGRQVIELNWANVSAVILHNGGLFGGRSIEVSQGHAEMGVLFSPTWTECSSKDIMGRLIASAKASGFGLEKESVGWRTHFQERWTVISKA